MLVVLDTNVLVSALLSPHGTPANVLNLALTGELCLAFDDRILDEYREVLLRPKFDFAPGDVGDLLAALTMDGEHVIAQSIKINLPDEDDLPFLEVAASVNAPLITGNLAHFAIVPKEFAQIVSPAQFMKMWKK